MSFSKTLPHFWLIIGVTISLPAFAQDVTNPGNPITGSSNNFPAAENPAAAIDNRGDTKYLNFDKLNTGFTVTPSGSGVVRGITFMTANDAPQRDPASYTLEGSNDGAAWFPIASGAVTLPTPRFALAQVLFPNSTVYTQYRIIFPTVRTPSSANSMQIGEIQLITRGDVLTPGDGVAVTLPTGATLGSPAEGGDKVLDNQVGTKLNVVGGNLGPTIIDITPGVGGTLVTGLDVFGANDDVAFPNRTPGSLTLSGSNDGVNYTPIFTTTLTQNTFNYQDQQFFFANATAYARYRVELGASLDGSMQIGELQLFGQLGTVPPANDNCAVAPNLVPGSVAGSTVNATGTDTTTCGTGDSLDVWYSYTPAASALVEVNTCGAGTLDTTLAVYDGCGGPLVRCDDNSCGAKSRIRWQALAGHTYKIRVAGVGDTTGSFTLALDTAPVVHSDVTIPLTYNFNGIVHAGESGDPDNSNGYRSISDRGIRQTGTPGSIEVGLEGLTGIPYSVVTNPFTFDIVHLGNRNTVDNGNWAFDTVVGGFDDLAQTRNFVGVQPAWLTDTDQRTPQSTDVSSLNLVMAANTRIGLLVNSSNGGTVFNVTLGFQDSSTIVVPVQTPDWFGSQTVFPPNSGVEQQAQLGLFFGAADTDNAQPDVDLNILEAIVSVPDLIADGFSDITGRRLTSITFSDPTSAVASTAIYAATVRDAAPRCIADFNGSGAVTVQDIFDFLAAYFTANPAADVNGSGSVTVQDIFDYLASYFAGCP
jgi:hypothetical protein